MTQFSVYPMPRSRSGFVVDVQSRFLDQMTTRVVIPLLARRDSPAVPIKELNPTFFIEGEAYVLMAQNIAAIPAKQLGKPVGSLAVHRDQIVRSLDALLSGI